MLESLTKYWGFYIVVTPDVNGVGVRDLHDILDDVATYREWVSDISQMPPGQQANQNEVNNWIAFNTLQKVLAARIMVFQLFLQCAIQLDGNLQEKHKHIWLLFQLSDQLGPYIGTLHPFVRIVRKCLRRASTEALDILVERLNDIRETYLPQQHFIVGLDEAQRAARLYRRAFISSTNNGGFQSILPKIVEVFTKLPIKLVVSGTGLPMAELEEVMASGVSKPAEGVKLFHQLGMFDTWPKLKSFLERYVPASILESPSGYRLQQRMQEYLLGR